MASASYERAAPRAPWLPMPRAVQRLFSMVPLHTWPAACADEQDAAATGPVLYVAPAGAAHPWMSADPVSLRWQLELRFRGVDFTCREVRDAFWSPDGAAPVLVLAPGSRPAGAAHVLGAADLPAYVEHYAPLVRPEAHDAPLWSDAQAAEAPLWRNLLEHRVMAGAVLACLRAGLYGPADDAAVPLLRRWLRAYLPGERTPAHVAYARAARLGAAGASASSLAAVHGSAAPVSDTRNPLGQVPGFTFNMTGFLQTEPGSLPPDPADADALPPHLALDVPRVLQEAAEALDAVLARWREDSERGAFILGARMPTSLDALLLACVHAVSALPRDVGGVLRTALERGTAGAAWAAYAERLHTYLP